MASPYYRSHYQPSRTFYQGIYQPHQTFYQPHQSFSQHFRSPYQPSFYQPNYYQPVYNPIASAPVQSVPTVRIVEANAVSPAGAAAALAYVNTVGAEDLCGRAAKAYLESVVAGGDSVAATQAATTQYMADHFNKVASGTACDASAKAFKEAQGSNQDPVLSAAQAYMTNYKPVSEDLCSASGAAYVKAVLAGANQDATTLAATKAFVNVYSAGTGLAADSACAAAAKAFSAASVRTPSAPVANAMTAFIANTGAGRSFDPACAAAASAYVTSFEAGEQELDSALAGGLAFIKSYKSGAVLPTNSPCTAAAMAYSAALPGVPSAIQTAMTAFIEETVEGGDQDNSVCLTAGEAYIESYLSGVGEAMAEEAAGIAFIDAVAASPSYSTASPCGKAARAYITGF